jgi:hypothetical protein
MDVWNPKKAWWKGHVTSDGRLAKESLVEKVSQWTSGTLEKLRIRFMMIDGF